jgi:hypothetical protein
VAGLLAVVTLGCRLFVLAEVKVSEVRVSKDESDIVNDVLDRSDELPTTVKDWLGVQNVNGEPNLNDVLARILIVHCLFNAVSDDNLRERGVKFFCDLG